MKFGDTQTRAWKVTENRPGHWRVTCEYEADGTWFTAIIHDGYVREIAEMIAAAPDLLAACKAALPFLEESWKHMGIGGQFEMMDALRAAIAKAGGAQ